MGKEKGLREIRGNSVSENYMFIWGAEMAWL